MTMIQKKMRTVKTNMLRSASLALALLLTFATLLLGTGCSEILSADISQDSVVVLGPSDSIFTQTPSVLFWWEENRDIEKYRFQVANPTFDNPVTLADTTVIAQMLTMSLEPGQNIWRIKGVNEGSETVYIIRVLFVDQSAPDKATATHLDGDTIAVGDADSLRWTSRDQPIEGIRYPVADSVYLSLVNDSTRYQEGALVNFGESRAYPAEDGGGLLASGKYWWYLVTVDKAGNTRRSNTFSFVVQ
jgi:hypothetical protein